MKNVINTLYNRSKKYLNNAAFVFVTIITMTMSVVPTTVPTVHAQAALDELIASAKTTSVQLPVSGTREPSYTMTIPVSAYNSLPNQTDATPFNTADGTYVRDGLIAANFLPLGTRVRFPEIYGDKEFIVKDRMNPRYTYKADIWMEEYKDAIQFGVKYTTIEIF